MMEKQEYCSQNKVVNYSYTLRGMTHKIIVMNEKGQTKEGSDFKIPFTQILENDI
jgi:hypothetical protein